MNYPIVSVITDSFQEYADEWSLVTFCYGCNFKCNFCYNRPRHENENAIIGEFNSVVPKKINPSHTAVVFLGGEPTIWRDGFINALSWVKKQGLKTKCYTNGYMPLVIYEAGKQKLLDSVSVDFKCVEDINNVCGVNIESDYLIRVDETIENCSLFGIDIELRTTICQSVENTQKTFDLINKRYGSIPHIKQDVFKLK